MEGMQQIRRWSRRPPELSEAQSDGGLADDLTMAGPVMADLDTSEWELVLKHTKKWYDKYMTEPPLQLLLTPTPPNEVSNGRWRRVERRAATLLMKALPDYEGGADSDQEPGRVLSGLQADAVVSARWGGREIGHPQEPRAATGGDEHSGGGPRN